MSISTGAKEGRCGYSSGGGRVGGEGIKLGNSKGGEKKKKTAKERRFHL